MNDELKPAPASAEELLAILMDGAEMLEAQLGFDGKIDMQINGVSSGWLRKKVGSKIVKGVIKELLCLSNGAKASLEIRYYLPEADSTVAHFCLSTLPGCCGVVVSHYTYVSWSLRKKGIGKALQSIKKRFAKVCGFSCMLCTYVGYNVAQEKVLKGAGWEQVDLFRNLRTGNIVNIGVLKI